MNSIELHIDELQREGWGVASWLRPDGRLSVVTVPNSLPGETVVCDLFRASSKKTSGLVGDVKEIKTASPLRLTPLCKHFPICGGCTWQQMPSQEQLRLKEETVKSLFFDLITPDTSLHPIIGSPSSWRYRNKMEFSFSEDTKGQKFLGLIMRYSKGRVFTVEECHLVNPWMAKLLQAVYAWWSSTKLSAYYLPKNSGHLKYLTLREGASSGDRVVILTVSGNPDYPMKRSDLDGFVRLCTEHATPADGSTLTCVLCIQQVHKGRKTEEFEMRLLGPDYFREHVRIGSSDLEFHISPRSFFQPNSATASRIYEIVLQLADLRPDMVLYDLYAGIGIFGMCAAHLVKEVLAIELSADSAYDAKVNSERLQLTNFRILRQDVAKALQDPSLTPPDVVIVDPPRSGLGSQAVKQIVAVRPHTIVYVSCNPKTQSIDVKELLQAGYSVTALQPIDQFPQTTHVENIAILKRTIQPQR